MNTDRIHVSRGELPLGIWTLGEVRELLASGFLLPTDDYWMAGQPDWIPLNRLPADSGSKTAALASRMGQALREAAESVEEKARQVIRAASAKAGQQKEHVAEATERLLNDYVPRLRDPVQRALAATSHTVDSALRDEAFLRKLFGAVYDLLPRPVCRFVAEQPFIEFCLKHRMRLLRNQPASPADQHNPPAN